MPRWDDPRGPRRESERDRWRDDPTRERREWPGAERRAFADRPPYGWRRGSYRDDEDAGSAGYRSRGERSEGARSSDTDPTHAGEPWAYGGQEYGLERSGYAGGGGWGFDRDNDRRRNFDRDDPGVGQSQAGYGQAARSHPNDPRTQTAFGQAARPHPDADLDPDYLRWRDEQLRAHDRDYHDWRREQHQKYDEQYRQFRNERQRHFGEAFHEWRSHRSFATGVPDTSIGSVGQGQGGYGDKSANPGGYNEASAVEAPSGYLDPPGHLSADPAMRQTGGYQGPLTEGSGGDHTPEFGKEPLQVKAAADGKNTDEERERR
jgi:hypothetical protein